MIEGSKRRTLNKYIKKYSVLKKYITYTALCVIYTILYIKYIPHLYICYIIILHIYILYYILYGI